MKKGRKAGKKEEGNDFNEMSGYVDSFSTESFLGLSLHPDQICLVAIEDGCVRGFARRELVRFFDLEAFRRGEVHDLADVLGDLYRKTGARGVEVGIAIHGGMVLVKKTPVALGMEDAEARDQILWESEQWLVAPGEEYVIEHQRLPFQTPEGNPVYLMVLVRKEVVEGMRALVEGVGLSLNTVDVDMFSNIRALLINYDVGLDETCALVDVESEYIDFVILRRREYFLSHRVPLERNASILVSSEDSVFNQLLLKELRRLVFGHRLGRGIEDLSRIFVLGSDVVQTVCKKLSASVPVEIVNPFRRVKVSTEVYQSDEVVQFPQRFVASVGVALMKVSALTE